MNGRCVVFVIEKKCARMLGMLTSLDRDESQNFLAFQKNSGSRVSRNDIANKRTKYII